MPHCLHRMTSRIFLVGVILQLTLTTSALEITACDCSAVDNLGLLAFQDPEICRYDVISTPIKSEYLMMARETIEIEWDGFTCAAWVKEKKIEGYFFGAYDTTFDTYVVTVSEDECKHMQKFKTCFGNQLIWNGEFYQFEKSPSGEGAWMQTVTYKTVNCIVKAIKLSKSCEDCSIKSSFGKLSNDSAVQTAVHNHVRFIWENPKRSKPQTCELTKIIEGTGYVTRHSELAYRLVDNDNQLEFIYNPSTITKCEHENINQILGLPDAFLSIKQQMQRPLVEHELFKHKTWGTISIDQNFSSLCVELNQNLKSLTLKQCSNSINQLFRKIGNEVTFSDQEIAKCKFETLPNIQKFCVEWDNSSTLIPHNAQPTHIGKYTIPGTGWIFAESNHIKMRNLCLDVYAEGGETKLWMSQCEAPDIKNKTHWVSKIQQWKFTPINLHDVEVNGTTLKSKNLSSLTHKTVGNISDNMILVEHHQFIEGRAIERENLLAKEIRNIYCQLQKVKFSHITSLAQSNGFLAANALEMPLCRRIQASGKSLLVQRCKPMVVYVKASESFCGFAPTFQFNNVSYTIGLDGYSMHRFNNEKNKCFWRNGIVNLNDKTYAWTNNDGWKEVKPNIWSDNVEIVKEFNETVDNEFQYMIVDHPSNTNEIMEQLNMLNDVLSDIFSSDQRDTIIDTSHIKENRFFNLIDWIKSIIASTAVSITLIGIGLSIWYKPSIVIVPYLKLKTLMNQCCPNHENPRPIISYPVSRPPSPSDDLDEPFERYSLVPVDGPNGQSDQLADAEA